MTKLTWKAKLFIAKLGELTKEKRIVVMCSVLDWPHNNSKEYQALEILISWGAPVSGHMTEGTVYLPCPLGEEAIKRLNLYADYASKNGVAELMTILQTREVL